MSLATSNGSPKPNDDAEMLQQLGYILTDLQYNYMYSTPIERSRLKPAFDDATDKYVSYRVKLLADGVITTAQDLEEMRSIKTAIDTAANTQTLLSGIARLIAFFGLKGGAG